MCASKMLVLAVSLLAVSSAMRVRKEAEFVGAANDVQKREDMPVLESDINPIGEGTIPGGHGLLVQIFGEPDADGVLRLSVPRLRRVSIDRRFPVPYKYGQTLDFPGEFVRPTDIGEIFKGGKGGKGANQGGGEGFVTADIRNTNFIICPFLATLVNEGAIPVKQSYTREELQEASITAGLNSAISSLHVAGNFLNNPAGVQDIFNMEGATNEHVSSTGIHDCETTFQSCSGDTGSASCISSTDRGCPHPDPSVFDVFVESVDTNTDGFITQEELDAAAERAEAAGIQVYPRH